MKKTLFFAAAAICAAALAVSCEKREVEVSINPSSEQITLTCIIAEPDTKLAIDEQGKTTWEVGDEILIHGEYTRNDYNGKDYYAVTTLKAEDISADGKKAIITIDGITPYDRTADNYLSTLYAAYPASAVLMDNHCYWNTRFTETNHPLMAGYVDNANNTVVLHNLCGVISFVVEGDFDSYEFAGNNGETVGYSPYQTRFRLADDEGTPTEKYDIVRDGDSCTSVALDKVEGKVVADGSTVNYVYLPTGADFIGGFTFSFAKNGDVKYKATTTTPVDVALNKMLQLGNITSKLKEYTHQNQITDATNLGASETANCYIITAPGSYKIPAVKGNSNTSAGIVAGVQLVWETYNNNEEVVKNSVIAAVDYETDAVFFKTPDSLIPGNALIAALDAEKNIIWSWHIWIPATAIEEVGSYNVSAKYLMDRNLGALKATEAGNSVIDITSVGLFYQWGRKDPFVGPGYIDEGKYPGEGPIAGTARTASKVQISLEESIAQPTLFARGLYINDKQVNPDWCSDQDGEYWGDNGDKTIYDPCPAGYRIPKRDKNKLLWADTMTGYEYNADYYWFKVGDPAVVFPAIGWIDGGTAKSTCRFGLWNAHHDSWVQDDPNEATYGYGSYAAYARRFYLDGGSVKLKNSSVYKSLGYSVRCESINKAVPEPDLKGATNVVLDGNVSEWANADAIAIDSSRLPEWRFGSDSNNLYFYFKVTTSKIQYNAESGDYSWASYIYIGLDTDNDSSTGARVGGGTSMETGGEIKICIFPWRGNHNESSLAIVNGVDGNGYIQNPVGTATESHPSIFGSFDGDYCYLEVGIPKSALGSLASKIRVSLAMDYSTASEVVIPM